MLGKVKEKKLRRTYVLPSWVVSKIERMAREYGADKSEVVTSAVSLLDENDPRLKEE